MYSPTVPDGPIAPCTTRSTTEADTPPNSASTPSTATPRPRADVPTVLADLPPRIVAQFDRDWTASRHRRPKCSKADFAAGWRTAMERNLWKGRVRKPGVPDFSSDAAPPPNDDDDEQCAEFDHTA